MNSATIETIKAKKSRNRSKRITTIIHIGLLALLLFPFMNATPPEPELTTVKRTKRLTVLLKK